MIESTFDHLVARIKKIKPIAEVHLFRGQYENPSQEELMPPCVFIEFENISFTNMAGNYQMADATLIFHLCISKIHSFGNDFAEKEVFSLLESLHESLQGSVIKKKEQTLSSPLNREAMAQITGNEPLQIWTITYKTTLFETEKKGIKKPNLDISLSKK